MQIIRKWVLPYLILVGFGLAISVPWLLAVWTDDTSSSSRVAATVASAVSMAVAGALILLITCLFTVTAFSRLLHLTMAWVTFGTVHRAITRLELDVEPTGIDSIDGDIRIGLPVGLQSGLMIGDRFVVLNAASQEKWGELVVAEIDEFSCACSVYNRHNPTFWDSLEGRMRQDASPPQGVVFRREIPEEYLLDWLKRLLKPPRG